MASLPPFSSFSASYLAFSVASLPPHSGFTISGFSGFTFSGFSGFTLSLYAFSLLGFSAWQQDSDLCLVLHIMLRSAHALSGCLYTDREGGRKEGVAINIICAVTAVKPE